MEIRNVPLQSLQPADYNPRVTLKPGMPGYERLQRSLHTFGLVQPLVWNETTGHLVGGHQRLELLRQRGDATVPVVVVKLSLETEKTLNVALNNARVGGEWDVDRLTTLVEELVALPDIDATLTGFSTAELAGLLYCPDEDFINAEDSQTVEGSVVVTLEIPPHRWEAVRAPLEAVLKTLDLEVHVTGLPT